MDCPRSVSKSRTLSLVVGSNDEQQQHGFKRWIVVLQSVVPLIFIRKVQSYPMRSRNPLQNPYKLTSDWTIKPCLASFQTWPSLVLQGEIFLRAQFLHPDPKLDVSHMYFDHLDERTAMVKSIQHFENFTKPSLVYTFHIPLPSLCLPYFIFIVMLSLCNTWFMSFLLHGSHVAQVLLVD
jgi:hypothetical protein